MLTLDDKEAQQVMPIEEGPQSLSLRYVDDVSVVYTLEFKLYHRV